MTDYFGYTRFVTNQTAGVEDNSTNKQVGMEADSDSDTEFELGEATIFVPSCPPPNVSGTSKTNAADQDGMDSSYAEAC